MLYFIEKPKPYLVPWDFRSSSEGVGTLRDRFDVEVAMGKAQGQHCDQVRVFTRQASSLKGSALVLNIINVTSSLSTLFNTLPVLCRFLATF